LRDRYATPQALDAAIRAKARQAAQETGASPADLITSFHFQRLLARVFQYDGWMLKGGQSLLVRYPSQARLSRDADLFRADAVSEQDAIDALDRAIAFDLDDYFRFSRETVTPETNGAKVKVGVQIGTLRKASLEVDLVVRRTPTGTPTLASLTPAIPIDWPDTWPTVRLYPLVDHTADKICAMWEKHLRIGRDPVPSTRYRDLADLLLIAQKSPIDGRAIQEALAREVTRRNASGTVELKLPAAFEVPDQPSWREGYPKAAAQVTGLNGCRTLEEATPLATQFITPLLSAADPGIWDPGASRWSSR
jgi:hypothetical protein